MWNNCGRGISVVMVTRGRHCQFVSSSPDATENKPCRGLKSWLKVLILEWCWGSSKTGKVLNVQVTGCETSDVCEFKRGEKYNFDVSFESLTDSASLRAVIHGIVGGVAIPFPIQNANACEHSEIECPLQTGQTYNYGYEIEVRNTYPTLKADVKWELKDDKNQDVFCVQIPVQVV
ncbi:NPC intracellular cholesterol transporter 2 [Trichonephila clavipes]|nr:NPC intracellular cholesterol transporter 2 [Trichonephila clavipes]